MGSGVVVWPQMTFGRALWVSRRHQKPNTGCYCVEGRMDFNPMTKNADRAELVFKIAEARRWDAACQVGTFDGSADDVRDGFIHLSTKDQLRGTLEKHFIGKEGLVLIAFWGPDLGPSLRWEASRGGDLFPHLYAALPTRCARWQLPLELASDGIPVVPRELPPC